MVAAITNGIEGIEAECGGALTCGTCHVYVAGCHASHLPGPSEAEDAMLDGTTAPRRADSRLSCQIVLSAVFAGLVLHVPG